jgi:hypothetical protein
MVLLREVTGPEFAELRVVGVRQAAVRTAGLAGERRVGG